MLRITPTDVAGERILRLEGRLIEPWPVELHRAWHEAATKNRRVVLDVAGLMFVDAAGAECLRELLARGAKLRGCSGFIAELLNGNGTH
jgi:anti-anti-sigma regulatory factor